MSKMSSDSRLIDDQPIEDMVLLVGVRKPDHVNPSVEDVTS